MLKGSLKTVALPEVLNFLADTGKSGKFHVSGSHGEGRLWFDQGRISGINVSWAHEPSEAIFELLRIDDGEFDFAADEERPEDARGVEGDEGAVAPALQAAEAKLAEWRDIVAVVPSLAHRVHLRAETPAERVTLEPEQWMMVVAVGAGRTVAEVIDARELQEFEGCKAVRELVEAALVEVLEPVADEPVAEEPEAAEEPVVEAFAEQLDEGSVPQEPVSDESVDAHDHDPDSTALGFGSAEPAPQVEAPEAPVFSPFSFGSVDSPSDSSESDHYAALRAAMVEVGENLTADEPEAARYTDEPAHPVYEFHADPVDSRAALQALLSEVADDGSGHQPVHDEVIDGLADRGPWTDHELSTMDSQRDSWNEPADEMSNVVPFAPVHSAEEPAGEAAAAAGETEPDEAEEAPATEEPINRGLLLKFLSSVRN